MIDDDLTILAELQNLSSQHLLAMEEFLDEASFTAGLDLKSILVQQFLNPMKCHIYGTLDALMEDVSVTINP